MAANRVADLTIDELKALIRETFQEVLEEVLDEEDGENLAFKPAIANRLRKFLKEEPDGEPVDDLLSEFGLNEQRQSSLFAPNDHTGQTRHSAFRS